MREKKAVRRVISLIRPYRGAVCMVFLLAFVTVVFTLYTPVLIGKGVDLIAGSGRVDFPELFRLLIVLGAVVGAAAACPVGDESFHEPDYLSGSAGCEKCSLFPSGTTAVELSGQPSGRRYFKQDLHGCRSVFRRSSDGIYPAVHRSSDHFGNLDLYGSDQSWNHASGCADHAVSFFVAGFVARRTYAMFKQQSETRAEMTSLVEELVGNQKLVKAFSYEGRAEKRFDRINEELRVCGIRALFFSSITNPATRFINNLVYTGVGILGAFTAISGGITVGQLTSFLSYANQYTKPFNEISGVVTELQNALASRGGSLIFWMKNACFAGRSGGGGAERDQGKGRIFSCGFFLCA